MILLSQKWFQTCFLVFSHASLWFVSCKTSKWGILTGFWEILSINGPIFAKNRSQNFKLRYLKNTFSNRTWERNELERWNLAKLWGKMVEKKFCNYFSDFWLHFEKNGLCMLHNWILSIHNPFLKMRPKIKKVIATFFPTVFLYNLAKFQLSSMFLSQVIIENVFLRYRDLKFWDPFLAKNGPFLLNISQNPENIPHLGILHDWYKPWRYMKNTKNQV